MSNFLGIIILLTLFVNFAMVLMDKWGIREWLQLNAPCDFLYKLFTCDFCTSFWLGVLFSLPLIPFYGWWVIFAPIFSSSLIDLSR